MISHDESATLPPSSDPFQKQDEETMRRRREEQRPQGLRESDVYWRERSMRWLVTCRKATWGSGRFREGVSIFHLLFCGSNFGEFFNGDRIILKTAPFALANWIETPAVPQPAPAVSA